MKQAQFDKLVQLAPCPVRLAYCGMYAWDIASQKQNMILINRRHRTHIDRIFELIHEIGHATHHANGCKCHDHIDWDDSKHTTAELCTQMTLCEYHAMRFAMGCIKNNSALIKKFISYINRTLRKGSRWDCVNAHYNAAKRITKLRQWQRFYLTSL